MFDGNGEVLRKEPILDGLSRYWRFFFQFRVLLLNFSNRLFIAAWFVVKYFREFSGPILLDALRTLSSILAVATKSQLGSILAWDLDAEQLLLRELESASDPGVEYFSVQS